MKSFPRVFSKFLLLNVLILLQACEEQPVNLMIPYDVPAQLITIPPAVAPSEIFYGIDYTVKMDSVLSASNLSWDQLTYIHSGSLSLEAADPKQTITVLLDSIRLYLETDTTARVLIGHRYQNTLDSSATITLSADKNDLREQLRNDVPRLIFAAIIRKNFTDTLAMTLKLNLHIRAEETGE